MPQERVHNFSVIYQPAEEGGYNVFVPALPGCVTQGKTLDEAKRMAEEAISLYCESLTEDGEPIPDDHGELVGRVTIKT